ncbi:uncharacterized protein [Delphinus delphis]|uniref:uncharacterized protein n=1 Tax=Delphinus delphis TaxID=9728 RepID=UPI0037526407
MPATLNVKLPDQLMQFFKVNKAAISYVDRGSPAGALGIESSPAFGYIFICGNRKARSRGDRAERVGSGRSRRREGSRGDRGWVVREGRLDVPSSPVRCRTPPAGRGRRRRGRPGPLPERRARPRKQGGAAARPIPRRKRPHGAEEAARRRPEGPPAGSTSSPPPPVVGELWARAPGGPRRTPRRTHRGRTAGEQRRLRAERRSGDRFLPKPTPPAAAAVAAAAAATPAPESAAAAVVAAAAPLPLRSPLPLWPEPRPCTASSLGQRRTGLPRPP